MASPTYRITYKGSVAKELRKIDRQTQKRLLAAIEGLATNPRPDGVKKLKSKYDQYRIRVGNYRVVYEIADGQLRVLVLRVPQPLSATSPSCPKVPPQAYRDIATM